MDNDDINFPDVKTGTENTAKYKELTEAQWSPFLGKRYKDIFIFAMAYAYATKLIPEKVSGEGNMPARVFDGPTRNLMRSLAVEHTNDLNIIKDSEAYVKICEEYANAGFKELYKIINENDLEKIHREDLLNSIIKNIISEQD